MKESSYTIQINKGKGLKENIVNNFKDYRRLWTSLCQRVKLLWRNGQVPKNTPPMLI